MDFSAIPLFSTMKARLNHASERQAVLAQNIANVDTPNYKARDITAPDFKSIAKGASGGKLKMAMTDAQHLSPMNKSSGHFKVMDRVDTSELNPNGNNVVIEDEMKEMAGNQAAYTETLNLYRKALTMFKSAVGTNTGGG